MKGIGCLLFFAIFWSAIVLTFDCMLLYSGYKQVVAESWPTTNGVITESRLRINRDSDGDTYEPVISYRYMVGDQVYTSDTFRFDNMSSSDRSYQRGIVNDHPRDMAVKVWYNPDDPSEAVLSTGLTGQSYFMMVALSPFNVVMVGLWFAIIDGVWRNFSGAVAGGVKILRSGGTIRARLTHVPSIMMFGMGYGCITFAGVFILIFSGLMYWPQASLATLAIAATVGIALWIQDLRQRYSGYYDLIIDRPRGTLWLPQSSVEKEKAPERIDLFSLQYVSCEEVESFDSDGDRTVKYAPTLWWVDLPTGSQSTKLAEWNDEDASREFTEWLRNTLGLPDKPLEDESEAG